MLQTLTSTFSYFRDAIFKDAGMPDDDEERAPLRSGHAAAADTSIDPPQLTEEDYQNGPGIVGKIFGPVPTSGAAVNEATPNDMSRSSSRDRNYRSLDQ